MKVPSRIIRWLRWAIAIAAMAYVARQLLSDPAPLKRILGTSPLVLLGMCGLVVLNQALISLRFALAMQHAGSRALPFSVWFRLTAVGQMLNLFVPQLGNVYRGVTLKQEYGISYMAYATGLVSFVWLDAMMGVAIAFSAILALEPGLQFGGVSALLLLSLGELAIFFGPLLAVLLLRTLPPSSGFRGRVQGRLSTLLGTTSAAARAPGLMLRFLLLTVVVTVGQTASLWLAFHAVGGPMAISALVLFQVLLKLSSQIVITPGNLGITELAFGALAHGSSRTLEQGLAVSLLLRAVGSTMVLFLGVLLGGASFLTSGRRALLERTGDVDEEVRLAKEEK